jgi:outer membrane protein assembly factor BamD (BamD/ComL family)
LPPSRSFESFMAKYPDSALIPDAKKTLDFVKAGLKEEEKGSEKKTERK